MSITNQITCNYDDFEFEVKYTFYPAQKGSPMKYSVKPGREGITDWGTPDEPEEVEIELIGHETYEDIVRLNYSFEIYKDFESVKHYVGEGEDVELKNYHNWVNSEALKLMQKVEQECLDDAYKNAPEPDFDVDEDYHDVD